MNIERHASDRTAIRYRVCLAEQDRADDIFVNPGHSYTLALLSANPGPDAAVSIEDRIDLCGEVPSLMNRQNGFEFHSRCPFSAACCDTRLPLLHTFGDAHSLTCHCPQ
ncbi:MAG: hypothetical protein GY792_04600 [Gammaproteobacteria bacterium]|nr:hypothetical protein [Gammaproteobacteria bacterium]